MRHEHALTGSIASEAPIRSETASMLGTTMNFINELGSTAQFNFAQGGAITGTYTSKVSAGGGTIAGPITGWFNGYVLAWSVAWPTSAPTMTSWTGAIIFEGGKTSIDALWYLSTQAANPGDPTEFWNSMNAGADTFTQQ